MNTSVLRARINIVHFAKFKDDLQPGATSLLPAICIPTNMNDEKIEKRMMLRRTRYFVLKSQCYQMCDKLDRFW